MILDEQALDHSETSIPEGDTAAHCAAANGKIQAVKFLVERGEGYVPRSANKVGNTVLHLVVGSCADRKLIELLLAKGTFSNNIKIRR